MRALLFLNGLFLSGLFLSTAAHGLPTVANPHPGIGVIAIAGDSLAYGYGVNDGSFAPSSCFSTHFSGAVENYAAVGSTSAGLETRVPRILQKKPKLIFVSSGGNDVITNHFSSAYPAQKSFDEMGRVFDSFIASGALVIYLGLNPPYAGGERLPLISDIALAKGVVVVDGLHGFWGSATLMNSDGIHPTDLGYQILCGRLVAAISPYYP